MKKGGVGRVREKEDEGRFKKTPGKRDEKERMDVKELKKGENKKDNYLKL